ncbi:hypothetical protein WA016_05874 [Myxococcus stipitatus]
MSTTMPKRVRRNYTPEFKTRAVKLVLEEDKSRAQVAKDSTTYFGINLGKVTSWFLRAFTHGKKKSLVTRLPTEQAAMLAPGFGCWSHTRRRPRGRAVVQRMAAHPPRTHPRPEQALLRHFDSA